MCINFSFNVHTCINFSFHQDMSYILFIYVYTCTAAEVLLDIVKVVMKFTGVVCARPGTTYMYYYHAINLILNSFEQRDHHEDDSLTPFHGQEVDGFHPNVCQTFVQSLTTTLRLQASQIAGPHNFSLHN